jgi:hypothetical protein
LENITQLGNKFIVSYQQLYNKIPLWNVKIKLKVASNGQVLMIKAPCFANPDLSVQPKITMDNAKKNAAISYNMDLKEIKNGELLIYPERETGKLYLCWHFKLENGINKGVMIDAQTGQIVYEYDLFRDEEIRGTVRIPTWELPGNCDMFAVPDITPYCQDLKVDVYLGTWHLGSAYTNSSGYYSKNVPYPGDFYTVTSTLTGPHCWITDLNGSPASYSNTATTYSNHNWTWQGSSHYSEYFVFYYMNKVWHEYNAKVSGFSSNHWYTHQMEGQAHYGSSCNGLATGTKIKIGFDNHYGGSVYHEYTHNVIYRVNGYWLGDDYNADGRAMDEGLADYFSCSFRNDPIRHASNRRLDTKMKYPGSGGAHTRGQIIGGACWDLANKSGMSLNYVNALVYEAVTNLNSEETFGDFMDEILSADDNDGNIFNGTPHDDQICDAFVNDHAIIGSFLIGNLNILNDIIVENGATLTISPGSVLNFNNGSSLIVRNYGTLNANGSLSSPITFDFISSNSSTENGLKFYSNSMATINYCKIRNAYRGIYQYNWYINITNSVCSNCFYGLYLYNSSPTIRYCNFHNNVYAGIYLISSSPYLYNNYMRYNYYGVYCTSSSNPKFGYNSTPGENLTDNYCGVYCWNNSYPVLGRSYPLNGGYNNFVNASQNIYNASSGVVYAHHIWWGTTNPALFKISGSGTTSYTNYLTSSVTISPEPPLNKTSDAVYAAEENNIPMLSELDKADELAALNNLTEARKVCLDLINNYPDYSVSYNALNLLKETFAENEFAAKKDIYKYLLNKKAKKDLYGMAGLILAEIDKENKLEYYDEVIKNFKGERIVELVMFDKFVYYYFDKIDQKKAREILKELDNQFPLSEGAVEAHRIFGDEEYFDIEPIRKSEQDHINQTVLEFSLSNNYPNPFNPTTNIPYYLPKDSRVSIIVYNIHGQKVKELINEFKPAGSYQVTFNSSDLASGVYFYRIKAGDFVKTKRMLLIK